MPFDAPPRKKRTRPTYRTTDGTRVPSVTTVLGILNKPALVGWANKQGLQGIDIRRTVNEAAEIGTLAHYLIECHLTREKENLSEESPERRAAAYEAYGNYFEWLQAYDMESIMAEGILVSDTHGYGGTFDAYVKIDGRREVLDFKTSAAIYPEHVYQLAAYRELLVEHGHPVDAIRIVRVDRRKDAQPPFSELIKEDTSKDFELFRHCLDIYMLQKNKDRSRQ